MTGEDGLAAFSVGTIATKEDSDYTVQVDARDASGRTVTLSSSMLVTAASFQLSLEPATWIGQIGESSKILVHSRLYGDAAAAKPGAAVHVIVSGRRWENDKEVKTSERSFDVTTDADGNASIDWTPPSAGDFSFVATAKDESGRTTTASTYLWVLGSGDESYLAPIESPILIPDKQTVAPGGKVKVAIALPKANRDVVLMVSTDRLSSAQVVHSTGTTTSVDIEAPRDAATFGIIAMLPGENGVEQAQTTIKVTPPATRAARDDRCSQEKIRAGRSRDVRHSRCGRAGAPAAYRTRHRRRRRVDLRRAGRARPIRSTHCTAEARACTVRRIGSGPIAARR